MVTVYGARSVALPMIAGVVRMHAKIAGETPAGVPYSAGDARLLAWVQATATFGFAQAYHRYVDPLDPLSGSLAGRAIHSFAVLLSALSMGRTGPGACWGQISSPGPSSR